MRARAGRAPSPVRPTTKPPLRLTPALPFRPAPALRSFPFARSDGTFSSLLTNGPVAPPQPAPTDASAGPAPEAEPAKSESEPAAYETAETGAAKCGAAPDEGGEAAVAHEEAGPDGCAPGLSPAMAAVLAEEADMISERVLPVSDGEDEQEVQEAELVEAAGADAAAAHPPAPS